MRVRGAIGVFFLVCCVAALGAQVPVGIRISRVENSLVGPVVVKGRPLKLVKLEDRMRELKVPAVSVAVFQFGQIEWTRAWGLADVDARRKADADTRFQAASISKPVASVAALALVSRGRFALDENVNKYLKSWKLPENQFTATEKVTLRRLLTHSAGTTVSGFRGYGTREEIPTLLQVLAGTRPANSAPVVVDIPVGSRWRYSGGGLAIVQQMIEDETGKPFAQAARELVLEPFAMRHSTFVQPLPADLRDEAATGYRANGTAVEGRFHVYPEQAAAGLWTTPEDLARFSIELQKIAAGKSTKVLSQTLAAEMMKRQFEGWGLGVSVEGEGAAARFAHGGANEGYRSVMISYRSAASGLVVMTNSDSGSPVASELVRAVAREYRWPGLGPVERTLGTADPALFKLFAGRYEIGTRSPAVILRIESEGDRLFAIAGDLRSELLPESADTFFSVDTDMRIQFVRDASGRVTEARIWQGGVERRGTRSAGAP
jgi:CubicO group peptidase (beta-lactamase class C family)